MGRNSKVVVVGSANTDFVVRVPQLPSPGETILGGKFFTARGGKGANQAVAAARLGAQVTFVTRLGQDSLGRESIEAYRKEGIDVNSIVWDKNEPSGVALILVNRAGENIIAVAPGANGELSVQDVLAAEKAIREADCMLLQLEIPLLAVQTAVELAHSHGVRVILNPAPAVPLPGEILERVDILTPNETEARLLAGEGSEGDVESLAAALQSQTGVKNVVMTLGSKGALLYAEGQAVRLPAFPVTPVDTVAAGDAFNGALAVLLGRGSSLAEAVRYANAAGALAATRPGAQPSLPTEDEVERLLASAPISTAPLGA